MPASFAAILLGAKAGWREPCAASGKVDSGNAAAIRRFVGRLPAQLLGAQERLEEPVSTPRAVLSVLRI